MFNFKKSMIEEVVTKSAGMVDQGGKIQTAASVANQTGLDTSTVIVMAKASHHCRLVSSSEAIGRLLTQGER